MPFVAHTDKGSRPNNQDAWYAGDKLFIVCDGVGGSAYGEVASKRACASFAEYFEQHPSGRHDSDYLDRALEYTVEQFKKTISKYPETQAMSTTAVLLAFDDDGATIAWMGDSRLYHIRKGQILFVTEDHSLINELARQGNDVSGISRNIITQALNGKGDGRFSFHAISKQQLQAGDHFFLCTDGVLENITDEKINRIFSLPSLEQIKVAIIRECEGKTKDNFTFEIIES